MANVTQKNYAAAISPISERKWKDCWQQKCNFFTLFSLTRLIICQLILTFFIVACVITALIYYNRFLDRQEAGYTILVQSTKQTGDVYHIQSLAALALHARDEVELAELSGYSDQLSVTLKDWDHNHILSGFQQDDKYMDFENDVSNFSKSLVQNASHDVLSEALKQIQVSGESYADDMLGVSRNASASITQTRNSANKLTLLFSTCVGISVFLLMVFVFLPLVLLVIRTRGQLESQLAANRFAEQQLKDVTKNLNDAILQRFQALVHLRPVFEDAVSKAQGDFFGFIRLGFYYPHAKRAFEHLQTLVHRRSQELENLKLELSSNDKYEDQLQLFKPIVDDHYARHLVALQRTGLSQDYLKKQWQKDKRAFKDRNSVKLQSIIGSILPVIQKNHLLQKIFLRFSLFEVGRAESLRFVLNRDLHEGKALALDGVDRVTLFGKRFYNLLKKEHSTENWDFYRAVEEFRYLQSKIQVPIRGEEIYKRFIAPGAPDAVNLDSGTKAKVDDKLQQMIKGTKLWKQSVFDEAQAVIVELMASDPYKRFIRQDECAELYQSLKKEEQQLKGILVPLFKFSDKLKAFVTVHAEQCVKAGLFELAQEVWNEGMRTFEKVGNVCLPEADALLASVQHELLRIQECMARQDFAIAHKRNDKLLRMMEKLRKDWIVELLQFQDKLNVPPLLPLLKVDAIHRLERLNKAVERCLRDILKRNQSTNDGTSSYGESHESSRSDNDDPSTASKGAAKGADSKAEMPTGSKQHRHSGFFKSRVQRDEDEDDDEGGVVSLLASATERKGGTAERAASFEVLEMTAEQIRHSRMDLGIENDDRGSQHGSYASKGSNPDSPIPVPRGLDVTIPLHTSTIITESPSPSAVKPEHPSPLPSPINTKSSKDYRQMTPSKFDASDQVVADYYIKPLLSIRKQTDPTTPVSSAGFSDNSTSSPSKVPLQDKEEYQKKGPLQQAAAMLSRVIPSFGGGSSSSHASTATSSQTTTPEIPLQSLLSREKGISSSGSRLDDSVLGYNMPQIKLELTSIKDSPVMQSRGYPIVNSRSTSLLEEKDGGSAEHSPTNQGSQDRTFGSVLPDPSKQGANSSYISTSSSNDDLQFNRNPLEVRDISGGSISTTTISSVIP